MQEVRLSQRIIVGPEPDKKAMERLSLDGIRTILSLSRKGEIDQIMNPADAEIAAQEHDLVYVHFPLSLSKLKDSDVDEFLHVLNGCPETVYVHCCFGQRSVPLSLIAWGLREEIPTEMLLATAQAHGISWQAPFITDFVVRYLEKARATTEAMPAHALAA